MILLDTQSMRRADALTIAAGTAGYALMQRAGAAVAEAAIREFPADARIIIVCGPGNNGGDGFVAARILAARGFHVRLGLLGQPSDLKGDALEAADDWSGDVLQAADLPLGDCDLIIDALFGTGLTRDLADEAARLVDTINASGKRVVAVDIPSGIDSDSGQVRGAAVRADETVTFACRKPGHLLYPGRKHCGIVTVADIGIERATILGLDSGLRANHPAHWSHFFPVPESDGHKYGRGHAVVLSGGAGRTGAARLSARGALRAGAGLVTVASPAEALAENAAHLTAIMLRVVDGAGELAVLLEDKRLNALVIGPGAGVGEATVALVKASVARQRALVLDADALTSFAGQAGRLRELVTEAAPAPVVLTPHEGEFSRLFSNEQTVLDERAKPARARAAAALTGATVVLKGADTVIAAPDGRAAINENGSPWLATAGSGDVLAGIIAGHLAQGMPGYEAACAAVWLHGAAGQAGGPGLIAEDLPELLQQVLKALIAK